MTEESQIPDYIWIANNGETDPIDRIYDGELNDGNFYTRTADSKFRPLDTMHGNYLTEIEDHWPNTNDVLAVNPAVLIPYLEEGQAAKIPTELDAWVRSDKEGFSTTLRFDPEFHENPMEYDVILGSIPASSPQATEVQREYRERLKGQTVRITPVKNESDAVFQQIASLDDVERALEETAT
ncbi:hypothetical protein ACK3SF_03440 [Candidatus Nanosalina sp. VS9-1]|uniref:hypothetical protein n=1 Tax=Candidatus Nanosalina sp. VS9-1 TaxID=3388566 RepID=UPI0039E0307C